LYHYEGHPVVRSENSTDAPLTSSVWNQMYQGGS